MPNVALNSSLEKMPGSTVNVSNSEEWPLSYAPPVTARSHPQEKSEILFVENRNGAKPIYPRDEQNNFANRELFCLNRFRALSSVGLEGTGGLASHPVDPVTISPHFYLYDGPLGTISESQYKPISRNSATIIDRYVWIGARVLILDGVRIGDGAAIGAGAVIVKDIPPFAVAVGVPAGVFRMRNPKSVVSRLLACRWWDAPDEMLPKLSAIRLTNNIDELERILAEQNNVKGREHS